MMVTAESLSVRHKRSHEAGFTLIEVLIVVVIISVLVSIVLALMPPPCCPPPSVARVDIFPQKVYAAPGTRFLLDARVFGPTGEVIDVTQHSGLEIAWSSLTPGVVITNGTATVIVEVPTTPGTTMDVTATVMRSFDGQSTDHSSTPVVIEITPATGDGDWIEVPYSQDQRPIAVLIEAGEAGGAGCVVTDWTLAVVQKARLGRNLDDAAGCTPEFAVLGEDSEIVYDNTAYWTDQSETRIVTTEPVFGWADAANSAPDSHRYFNVVIGVPSGANNALAVATDHLKFASALMDASRIGIGLREGGGTFGHGFMQKVDPATACGETFIDDTMLDGSVFEVADRILFVFFVDDVLGATKGWACDSIPNKEGRVVYIALNEFERSTVVHEMAHTFGLKAPLLGGGHANGLGALEEDNIMWGSRDRELRKHRNRLSVGQLFRINLDDAGWSATLSPGVTVDCQDDALLAGPCPKLDKDLGEPGS